MTLLACPDHKCSHLNSPAAETCAECGRWLGLAKRFFVGGYATRYMPGHHLASLSGHVREHRLIAEKALGRRLRPEEVVHHKNNIGTDNRPQNLIVLASRSEHSRLHGWVRRAKRRAEKNS